MSDSFDIKQQLYKKCEDYVKERMGHILEAQQLLKESAATETKSSAGDKHETGRAKIQLEEDKLAKQLAEAKKLGELLKKVDPLLSCEKAVLGSLITTDQGTFYICISMGKVKAGKKEYFIVSATSPIFEAMKGKNLGDVLSVNGQNYQIKKIT